MSDPRIITAALIAIVSVGGLIALGWTYLDIPSLQDVPPVTGVPPKVSIIVAARDEARHIRAAARALLAQDYGDYDVVIVDDRSTDETGAILDGLAASDARLRVVHVRELPAGWLGKNHALHVGAERADGSILLFTDADVIFAPDALARAVRLLELTRADHLAVAVDVHSPTWPLALVVNYFMIGFLLYLRAWRVRDPKSRTYVGIGGFNMVRASAYRAVEGHARIRMRPDDDLMLGKVLKRSGFAQLLARADGLVRVEWYHSLGELARGLRKNSFAGVHYSVVLSLLVVVYNLGVAVLPFVAIWLTSGWERAWYASAAGAQLVAYAAVAVHQRNKPWLTLLYPLAGLILTVVFAAAVLRTLRRGGIEWRDTFYSLRDLRANRV